MSGTRPAGRMRRRRRRGSGAPRRLSRRTGKPDRGSEEARPARAPVPEPVERETPTRERMPMAKRQGPAGPVLRGSGREERSGGAQTGGESSPEKARISRATEVSGTRPAGRMRRRRRRGSGAPRRLMRRTGKPERGSEEARPAPTTGPRRQAREPAPRTDRQAGEQHRLAGPERRHGRSERGGGGATAGEDSTPNED